MPPSCLQVQTVRPAYFVAATLMRMRVFRREQEAVASNNICTRITIPITLRVVDSTLLHN